MEIALHITVEAALTSFVRLVIYCILASHSRIIFLVKIGFVLSKERQLLHGGAVQAYVSLTLVECGHRWISRCRE